jgi:hypothetical protein
LPNFSGLSILETEIKRNVQNKTMQKDLEIRDPEYKSIIACINSVSSLTSAAAARSTTARFAAALAAAARSSSARFAAAEACERKRKARQLRAH